MAAMPRRASSGSLRLKATEAGVEPVQRQLAGIEREVVGEHPQMDLGILVAGEADVSNLSSGLRPHQRVGDAAFCEVPLGIVVVDALVICQRSRWSVFSRRSDSSS
jgi:hypothetical protein